MHRLHTCNMNLYVYLHLYYEMYNTDVNPTHTHIDTHAHTMYYTHGIHLQYHTFTGVIPYTDI